MNPAPRLTPRLTAAHRQVAGAAAAHRHVLGLVLPVALGLLDAFLVNGTHPSSELGVSVAAALALLLRRRLPVAVLAVTVLGMYIGYIWFAPMIALYTVTSRRSSNALAVTGAAALALAHYIPYPPGGFVPAADRQGLLDMLDSCVQGAAPAVFGRWTRTRWQLGERVQELTASRHREAELLAERTVATEREQLAREMHDVVAHQVSLISVQAGALQMTCCQDSSRDLARTVRELAVRTLTELRHMVGTLRAGRSAGSGHAAPPRLADLPALTEESGLEVTLDLPGGPDGGPDGSQDGSQDGGPDGGSVPRAVFPEAVERAAYRTVQEALTNVRKHAPGAQVRVTVRVCDSGTADARLTVAVRNSPPTALPRPQAYPEGGHGLLGLRERALLLGGACHAGPTADGGFLLTAAFALGV
ncbi:sensor histidine kinase [Streptomyces qinglanensis]|uniref:histidine kinase n=1 Tax=Streptomyces qinglanensis TaxID=943816 RepID=A0A1H9PLT4_9ACTN|nr:histidine kinase [Streptomyces qinglanensis]SER48775.1 Signal transduction histidine kinase [Streptomyces qinglanensis]